MTTSPDPRLPTRQAQRLAERLAVDETTMAWLLARLRDTTRATDLMICARLGLDADRLPFLALCSRPRPDLFKADIEAVAEHLGIARRPLADLVREAETLIRFQPSAGRPAGLLAAARDRVAEDAGDYDRAPEDDLPRSSQ